MVKAAKPAAFAGLSSHLSLRPATRLAIFLPIYLFSDKLYDSDEKTGGRRVTFQDRRESRFFHFATHGKTTLDQSKLMRCGNSKEHVEIDVSLSILLLFEILLRHLDRKMSPFEKKRHELSQSPNTYFAAVHEATTESAAT